MNSIEKQIDINQTLRMNLNGTIISSRMYFHVDNCMRRKINPTVRMTKIFYSRVIKNRK